MSSDSDEEPERKIFKGDEEGSQELEEDDCGIEELDIMSMRSNPVEPCIFESFEAGEKIFEMVDQLVQEISVLIERPPSTVWVLLNHIKWADRARFDEAYFGNEKQLLEAANIVPPDGVKDPDVVAECRICADPVQIPSKLTCGHRICDEDLRQYLALHIEEGSSLLIECPVCKVVVPYDVVESTVEPETMKKYRRNIANLYVATNPKMQFCPGPGCDKFARLGPGSHRSEIPISLKCDCGMSFCFNCGKESHVPITCSLLLRWLTKCSDDSETSTWMQAHTKDCPKCHTMIEKNGGCNHMTCRNKACGHHFCWICMGDWNTHQGDAYNCNRFDEAKAKTAGEARLELERYLHYYNRYKNHDKSLKLEDKLVAIVQNNMSSFQNQSNMSWVDVQFLVKAGDILSRCRRTLKFTYSFAYFLKKSNSAEIFEDNQRDLESSTERLSDLLENQFGPMGRVEDPEDLKKIIVNFSSYCDLRCDKLINHVYEGNISAFWVFR